MPKPIRQDDDTSLRALTALAKLLARQAARQDFVERSRQSEAADTTEPSKTGSTEDE